MKGKALFAAVLAALCSLAVQAAAPVRYQYILNGITHISSDYERVDPGHDPFWVRSESVIFPDGTAAWLLYLNFEGAKALSVPKGVKMAATLPSGKLIRMEQIGTDSATKRAIRRDRASFYLNRTRYMVEPGEMTSLCAGVKSLDVITGWDPDDYIQYNFANDEFAKVIKAQTEAVKAAGAAKALSAEVARYSDNNNSLTVFSKPLMVKGASLAYNVGLTYLYYKQTDQEDFDLAIQLGSERPIRVPLEAEVAFLLGDGSQVVLRQTREDPDQIFLYPSVDEVRRMIRCGVQSVVIPTEDGPVTDRFEGRAFSDVLDRQYQLLMSVSPK